MYKIVISLCLFIPAIANAADYNLLERMQSALETAFTVSTNLLKTQVYFAQKNVDFILTTVPPQDPFSLDFASPSEDGLIEITLPAGSGSNQYEVGKYAEPANECAQFLSTNFRNKTKDVRECSESQLHALLSYKENLLKTFETTLETFKLFKIRSIACDRHSTTIVENMVDAWCVKKIELQVGNIRREADQLFSDVVRDVREIRKTWRRNLFYCVIRNEEPTAVLKYSQACKFELESDYTLRKT